MTHTTKDEALNLALEALEMFCEHGAILNPIKTRDAIKQVIETSKKKPVEWLTEERYAELHTSKWTPKIEQVFSKDGVLESQTIQYAPQSKPVPYTSVQRKPLTWELVNDLWLVACNDRTRLPTYVVFARLVESKHNIVFETEGNP